MSDSKGTVAVSFEQGVSRVTFSHPQGNSLPGDLLRQLAQAIDEAADRPETQVIVLQSSGDRVFCSGASFDELRAVKNLEESKNFFSGFAKVITALRRAPQLTIARVQGKTAGGGVGLAAACDYTIATQSAEVRLSELALGFGPFIIGPVVQRRIGLAAFSAMAIDTCWRDAGWAERVGLFSRVVPSVDLDAAVHSLATELASNNREAILQLKRVLWVGTDELPALLHERVAITAALALTPGAQARVAAMAAKLAAKS